MPNVILRLETRDGEELTALDLVVDKRDLDEFVEQLEDYFVGQGLSTSQPNLIPDYAEIL